MNKGKSEWGKSMKIVKPIKQSTGDLIAAGAAHYAAHLSSEHIASRRSVLVFQIGVTEADIERLTVALQQLRALKASDEAVVRGYDEVLTKR